jgi:hypothetical protein
MNVYVVDGLTILLIAFFCFILGIAFMLMVLHLGV